MDIHPDCGSCGRRYDQECAAQDASPTDTEGELVCWRAGGRILEPCLPRIPPYGGEAEPARPVSSGGSIEVVAPPPDPEDVPPGEHPPSFYRDIVYSLWMWAEGLDRTRPRRKMG